MRAKTMLAGLIGVAGTFLTISFASAPPEIAAPYALASFALTIVGILFVLSWHIIIPAVVRNWRLGDCQIIDNKYFICRRKGVFGYVGTVFVKVIPTMSVVDMPEKQREALLQAIDGMLAGAQYETMMCYIGVRDVYRESILQVLEQMKRLRLFFARSRAVAEFIERINEEIRLLRSVPFIVEGFYIAAVRDYGSDIYEVMNKLDNDANALISLLQGRGLRAEVLKGHELHKTLDYMVYGRLAQVTIA